MTLLRALVAALVLGGAVAACERHDSTLNGMPTGGGTAGTPPQPSSGLPLAPSGAPGGGPAAGTAGQRSQ
jgi:hypothetical protein